MEYELAAAPPVTNWALAAATDTSRKASKDDTRPPPRSPTAAMAFLFLAAAGAFAYFAQRGHLVGEIATAVILPCALHGVWRGGFRKIAMIAATLGLLNLFWNKPDFAAPLVNAVGAQSDAFSNVVAALLTSLVAWVTVFFVARGLHRRVIAKNRTNVTADRFVGATIGAVEGGLVVLTLCWLALSLRPYANGLVQSPDTVQGSARDRIGHYLLQIGNESAAGPLGRFALMTNPIDRVPELRNAFEQLNSTGKLNLESINSAKVQELRKLLEQAEAARRPPLN
jgi:colicin V production protein